MAKFGKAGSYVGGVSAKVYGFEAWNSQQKRRWRYQRSNKVISKNGVAGSEHDEQSFVAFVQRDWMP